MAPIKDIELLSLEMATLWEPDAFGRLSPDPLVAVAVASDGQTVRFGSAFPSRLERSTEVPGAFVGFGPPAILNRYRERLADWEPLRIEGGPSYVFPEVVVVPASSLILFDSEEAAPPILAEARPELWWESEEWCDLLAGKLGPWAIGMKNNRVVSLCHTPVGSSEAAEAGVWTHPQERGHGYAAVVTAAWAHVARRRFGTLFYSTGAENVASQGVARKLELRPVGWIWQLKSENSLVVQGAC